MQRWGDQVAAVRLFSTRISINYSRNRRLASAESEISTELIIRNEFLKNLWQICGNSCFLRTSLCRFSGNVYFCGCNKSLSDEQVPDTIHQRLHPRLWTTVSTLHQGSVQVSVAFQGHSFPCGFLRDWAFAVHWGCGGWPHRLLPKQRRVSGMILFTTDGMFPVHIASHKDKPRPAILLNQ